MQAVKRTRRHLLLALLTLALLAGQTAGAESQARIRVGLSPIFAVDVEPKDAAIAFRLWLIELGREVGFDVSSAYYESHEELAAQFSRGQIDMAGMRSQEYLRYAKQFGGILGVASTRGGSKMRKDVLLVRTDAGIGDVADLSGKRVMLAPESEVGEVFVLTQLLRRGVRDPLKTFGSLERRAKASQAILAPFFGQADACIASEASFRTMVDLNPQLQTRLKVLATSPAFVSDVTVFRHDFDDAARQRIVTLAPGLSRTSRGRQIMTLFRTDGLEAVTEDDLESLRALLAEYERLGGRRR